MTPVLLLFAAMQATPAPPPQDSDIVVTAAARRAENRVARQVEAVLPPSTFDQPLARFTTAVCPGVVGMTAASAQAVVDRIGEIAADVGLRVGEPGCDPNVLVVVTADGAGAVRRLVARRTANFAGQTLADIRRVTAEPGGARAWVESEVRSRDGDAATIDPQGGPPMLAVQGASRMTLGFRRDIVSAVVVIDTAAARGRDTRQIADYAAMRALADARPGRAAGVDSVLKAFTPAGDANAPAALTPFDRGLLRALYRGQGNVPMAIKRGAMARDMVREQASDVAD